MDFGYLTVYTAKRILVPIIPRSMVNGTWLEGFIPTKDVEEG